ncbi:MAG: hypothetical protein QX192_01730 [Methylococcales bacterium]
MILNILMLIFALLGAYSILWIYYDATNNKIGRIRGEGIFSFSAGEWASYSLIVWSIIFPIYLFKRKKLIQKAQENPVYASNVKVKLVILGIFSFLLFVTPILGYLYYFGSLNDKTNEAEVVQPSEVEVVQPSNKAYVFKVIEDKMNGNKAKVSKEDYSTDGLFYTNFELICDIQTKNIYLELSSYQVADNKSSGLKSAAFSTRNGKIVGKVKFDTSNPSSQPLELSYLNIDATKFNNSFTWDITSERESSLNYAELLSMDGKDNVFFQSLNENPFYISAKSSVNGVDFLENLGSDILIEYQNMHGVVQVDFSLVENDVKKVLNACRVKAPKVALAPVVVQPQPVAPAPVVVQPQPAFDCKKATKPTEITICANPELAALDVENMAAYKNAKNRDPIASKEILSASVKSKYACGMDISCIKSSYEKSIVDFKCVAATCN